MIWHRQFKLGKSNYTARHIIVVLLAFFTPILLGLPILYWQSGNTLQERAQSASRAVIEHVDDILDNARKVTEDAAPLIEKPCSEIVETLRIKATTASFVRSLAVIKNDTITCSTIYGDTRLPVTSAHFYDDRLALIAGNRVSPDRAILLYRWKNGTSSILAGIDGLHIIQLLNSHEMTPATTLIIGSYRLEQDGKVRNISAGTSNSILIRDRSDKYPFSVETGFHSGALRDYILSRHLPLIILLVILGGLSAFATNRMTVNARNMTAEAKRAIRNNEFIPYYQAIVRSDTHEWVGAEVLTRWDHPLEGMILPNSFIPFMERSGLIIPMTAALIRRVAEEFRLLEKQLPDGFHISINVSAVYLADPELIKSCHYFLNQFSQNKIRLMLELTEREAIEPTPELLQQIHTLRQAGILIALDDFGVGHSNLNYLKEFQADLLKIDRSFITGIGSNDFSRHVLQSIIDLSQQLGLRIIAEGIETRQQADYLQERGVQYLQGFYFSKPQPITVFQSHMCQHLSGQKPKRGK